MIMIHFARSTVPFNSRVLALQLLLVCVVQKFCQLTPVNGARTGLFISSKINSVKIAV